MKRKIQEAQVMMKVTQMYGDTRGRGGGVVTPFALCTATRQHLVQKTLDTSHNYFSQATQKPPLCRSSSPSMGARALKWLSLPSI